MRTLLLMIAIATTTSCASSEDPNEARARQCAQLRDHLVDVRLAGTQVDVEAHRAAIKGALGDGFVDRCTAQLTRTQIKCALAASDSAHALDCTRESTTSTN